MKSRVLIASILWSPNLDKTLGNISFFFSNMFIFDSYTIIFQPHMQSKVLIQSILLIPIVVKLRNGTAFSSEHNFEPWTATNFGTRNSVLPNLLLKWSRFKFLRQILKFKLCNLNWTSSLLLFLGRAYSVGPLCKVWLSFSWLPSFLSNVTLLSTNNYSCQKTQIKSSIRSRIIYQCAKITRIS